MEDDNLVYRSPSEMTSYLNNDNSDLDGFAEDGLDDSEILELPISNTVEILPPEEGSITRYANIFERVESSDCEDEDYNVVFRDSYSDTGVYGYNKPKNAHTRFNNGFFQENYSDNDRFSEKSMTFSDRVVQERQRMIRKKQLSSLTTAERPRTYVRRMTRRTPRPHQVEQSFYFVKQDDTQDSLDSETVQRHMKIEELLKEQQEGIKDLKINSLRPSKPNKNDALLYIQGENSRLVAENEQNCERIRNLKMELENVQSDLVVERKQNEQLLKDKVDLQNRVNFLSKENKSLLSSQELMQNMHNNEMEELKAKKAELSIKIAKLEKDLDYFRENLEESHKINEILKTEISSLTDVYKNERVYLQKLKIENKRLMENNSIYKSQNYSLIEINNRLRNRTLFRNYSGEYTTTNSSTLTNASVSPNMLASSVVSSPSATTNGALSTRSYGSNLSGRSNQSDNTEVCVEDPLPVVKTTDVFQILNSLPNSPTTPFSNLGNLDLVINSLTADNSPQSPLKDNGPPLPSDGVGLDPQNYNILRIIREERISNPSIKWVVDRVSRNSSVEALESLREKIRNITSECSVQNVNINSSLKCFQSNVTINLIQNKLQLISQRLNETIV